MSLNIKRGLAGAVLTALAAGAIALTAAAPASADISPGVPDGTVDGVPYTVTHAGNLETGNYDCGQSGLYGLYGYSLTEATSVVTYTFATPVHSVVITQLGSDNGREFTVGTNSASADFAGAPNPLRVDASTIAFGGPIDWSAPRYPITITDTSGDGFTTVTFDQQLAMNGICLSAPASIVPVAEEECVDGLAASVSNVNQTAQSAVVSGTGAAGETITIAGSPAGAVTAVVDASGNWTANVTGLATGDNALTVTSSDNCAPVELSVIIEELAIPVAHPAAAAAAGVLGLGALLFGGLRRRNTARI